MHTHSAGKTMRNLYVVINGQRRGPFNEAKVRAGLKAGKLKMDVELVDADTGDLVLADDLMGGGQPQQPQAPQQQGGVNYGRQQQPRMPQRRGQPSMYTQNAAQQSAQWNGGGYGAPPGNPQYNQQYGGGYNPYGYQQQYAPPKPRGMNPGLLPLIVSFVCWPIGLVGGITALKRARNEGFSEGLAWAAIIVSIIGAFLAIARIGMMAGGPHH